MSKEEGSDAVAALRTPTQKASASYQQTVEEQAEEAQRLQSNVEQHKGRETPLKMSRATAPKKAEAGFSKRESDMEG